MEKVIQVINGYMQKIITCLFWNEISKRAAILFHFRASFFKILNVLKFDLFSRHINC